MLDLITIGGIGADLFFKADNLTTKDKRYFLALGGKYYLNDFHFKIGGSAANIAIGVKKNGLKTAPCAIIGNNVFRKHITHHLKLKKISTNLTIFKQNYSNISIILLKENGDRTIINYETEHDHPAEDKVILRKIKKTQAVYLGNLPDVSFSERERLLRQLKKRSVFVFANFGAKDCCKPKKRLKRLLKYVDILILNAHELSSLAKKPYNRINFSKNILWIIPAKIKVLVVTDAEKGSYGYERDKVYFQKAIKPSMIVDTTGAGDGYTAGFISSYLRNEDVELAMRKGAQYASRILSKIGAN